WNSASELCVTVLSTTRSCGFSTSHLVTFSPSASRSLAFVAENTFTPLIMPPSTCKPRTQFHSATKALPFGFSLVGIRGRTRRGHEIPRATHDGSWVRRSAGRAAALAMAIGLGTANRRFQRADRGRVEGEPDVDDGPRAVD